MWCDHCNEWIHINCNGINDIDYKNLKTSNDTWYWKLCTKEILPSCSMQTNTDENNSDYSNINTNLKTMIIQKMKIYPTANTEILAISLII